MRSRRSGEWRGRLLPDSSCGVIRFEYGFLIGFVLALCKLTEVDSRIPGHIHADELIPGKLSSQISGFAAQHGAEGGFCAFGSLVVEFSADNTFHVGFEFFRISLRQIVAESPGHRKLALTGRRILI